MKYKFPLLVLSLALLFNSCSSSQFSAAATGSSLGGMFGSSIGSLMGGWRGSNKGTIAGMVIGGAIGVAATTVQQDKKAEADRRQTEDYDDYSDEAYSNNSYAPYRDEAHHEVQYGSYNQQQYRSQSAAVSDLQGLHICNIHFLDANDNCCLDSEEEAFIVLDIKNYSGKTLYNVTPIVTCNSRRVMISPAATISSLAPEKGVRYKTAVRAYRKLGKTPLEFKIEFANNNETVVAETFTVRTR